MKTYGSVVRERSMWNVTCEPFVMMRLKRVFDRVANWQHGTIVLADTPENCRELVWFLDRYPMVVPERDALNARAAEHDRKLALIGEIVSGATPPVEVTLALPPREYQKLPATLAVANGGVLCADELGLGKTVEAIVLMAQKGATPALVVTMTSLPRQWADEVARFAPDLLVHVIAKGSPYGWARSKNGEGGERKAQDLAKWLERGGRVPDVIITSYSRLSNWADFLHPHIKSIVFDEAQELRIPGSAKYTAATYLSAAASYRMALTATPIYNYGSEIFHLLEVVAPDALGSWDEFEREWCGSSLGQNKIPIADPVALGTYLRDRGLLVRRTRKDVGRELPSLQRIPQIIEADLSSLNEIRSDAADLARLILRQGGSPFEKMQASSELDFKLRQATGIAKAAGVADFVRMIIETGDPVVLYGWHREVYRLWGDLLKEYAPAFYTGKETTDQKLESKRRFLVGETPLLIISLRAGIGIDGLQKRCRRLVFGELDWSPGVFDQCIGRVHRDGQEEPVDAYVLYADSGSDPVIMDVLGVKRSQAEGVVKPDEMDIIPIGDAAARTRRLAEEYLRQIGSSRAQKPDRAVELPLTG